MKLSSRIVAVVLLALTALLFAAGSALAAPKKPAKIIHPPAEVKVGRVAFARTPSGRRALLVAVRYPLAAAGRRMFAEVKVSEPDLGSYGEDFVERVSAGLPRRADRRRSFTFVYELPLLSRFARRPPRDRALWGKPSVRVVADGLIDVDGDGKPELDSKAEARRPLPPLLPLRPAARSASASAASGGAKPLCASLPVIHMAPGDDAKLPLPACTSAVDWKIEKKPAAGSARLGGGTLTYSAPRTPGTETVSLNGADLVVKVAKPWASLTPAGPLGAPDAFPATGPVVRAMGDSVTAGFGYYSDGSLMPFLSLYECKPVGEVLDDACSSNSTATANGAKEVPYAPDYGLSNNVSWAAQWANDYGVTNYKNFAVSGSEPTNWAPGGNLFPTTKAIEAEDPDYILMTIGANPILASTLFGLGPAACALESDITGGYEECVEEAFQGVHLERELKSLYKNLVENTGATIYLMQYHLSIPSSALAYSVTQIAEMAKLMNEKIAAVAAEVNAETKSSRLQVVTPPHFDVGVSLEPVYPSSYTCSYLEYGVDGPSVQSTPTQDELEVSHPLSFCEGPPSGEPWVISGDTGIHPSAAGYAQMAAQVPPPAPAG